MFRKTSKPKLSLSKIDEDISTNREIEKVDQQQSKEKFVKVTRKLMKMTVGFFFFVLLINFFLLQLVGKNLSETAQENQSKKCSNDPPAIEEESFELTEAEQKNVELMKKLDEYYESDVLSAMDLSSLKITDDDIPVIFKRIFRRGKMNYRNVILRDNCLTSIGMKHLVDGLLKTRTNIRNIGLSSNPDIGDEGIEHLIRLLRESRSISILALHHTGITDQGVRLLADLLTDQNVNSFSPIEKLYISFNKSITDESFQALMQIMEENQTLKVFGIQHCGLSDKVRRRLVFVAAKKKKRKFSFAE